MIGSASAQVARTFRLDLEYDGAGFHGWAAQSDLRTIEASLRAALDVMLRAGYRLSVAGRTDTGVHASGQVASVSAVTDLTPARLLRGLGGLLPHDITVRELVESPPGFDARRDAKSRSYEYRLLVGPRSPLRRTRALWVPRPLDRERLSEATTKLLGLHDFQAFTPTETEHKAFERTVLRCDWVERGDELVFCVEADAFLRHMVRTMVGTLLFVGRGLRTLEWVDEVLASRDRRTAGRTVPAYALTLVSVCYEPD